MLDRVRALLVRLVRFVARHWLDILIALALALLTASLANYFGRRMSASFYSDERAGNVWFQADPGRVVGDMVWFKSNHYRVKVHPLFVLLTFPPGAVLRLVFGVGHLRAAQLLIVGIAFLFSGTFYTLLRTMRIRRGDALLFSLLNFAGASTLFGLTVVETYPFGAVSILLALMLVVISQRRRLSEWWTVAASALTLAFTVTNWLAGLLATLVSRPRRAWWHITLSALLIVVALWLVQKAIFPSSRFFIGDDEEFRYMLTEASGGPLWVSNAYWLHTMIMPAIDVQENNTRWEGMWPRMTVQRALPGSASPWGEVGVGLWGVLLLLSIYSILCLRDQKPLRLALAGFLLGQWVMHIFYGEETVLYAMHYTPPMIVAAALVTRTRLRPVALGLVALLIPCALFNNIPLLRLAIQVPYDHNYLLVPSQLTLGGDWHRWGIALGAGIGAALAATSILRTAPSRWS